MDAKWETSKMSYRIVPLTWRVSRPWFRQKEPRQDSLASLRWGELGVSDAQGPILCKGKNRSWREKEFQRPEESSAENWLAYTCEQTTWNWERITKGIKGIIPGVNALMEMVPLPIARIKNILTIHRISWSVFMYVE